MKPRTAAIVLAVLIVAFVAIMAIGATRGGSDAGWTSPSWTERIAETFSLNKALNPDDDLGASSPSSCRAAFIAGTITMNNGASCTLLMRKSTSRFPTVRTFTLTATGEGTVTIEIEQPGSLTVKETLTSGGDTSSLDVNIHEDGGTVRLSCLLDDCRLTVTL